MEMLKLQHLMNKRNERVDALSRRTNDERLRERLRHIEVADKEIASRFRQLVQAGDLEGAETLLRTTRSEREQRWREVIDDLHAGHLVQIDDQVKADLLRVQERNAKIAKINDEIRVMRKSYR